MASMRRAGRLNSPSAGVADSSRSSSASVSLAVALRRERKGPFFAFIVSLPGTCFVSRYLFRCQPLVSLPMLAACPLGAISPITMQSGPELGLFSVNVDEWQTPFSRQGLICDHRDYSLNGAG